MMYDFENLRTRRDIAPLDRFMEKVIPEPNSGCWIWLGALQVGGYGVVGFNGLQTTAHRVSWRFVHGEIEPGLEIDHKCRNRCCVNPDHLRLVTKAENLSHRTKERSVCWQGHRLSGDNVGTFRTGKRRFCRICRTAYRLKYKRKR